MIGEVILLAGQSNAELTIAETYERDTAYASDDEIRLFLCERPDTDENFNIVPLISEFNEKWSCLTANNARNWSAIALHTACYFHDKLQVPVGVVGCYKGASVIESFLSEKANEKFCPDAEKLMSDHFCREYACWNSPAFLYHYMFEQLIPFQMGAVVWYQGESNRTEYEGGFYDKMLICLVDEWRKLFCEPDLPFIVVQINLYPDNPEAGVIAIRKAQERAVTQSVNCRLVRIDDLGEHEKIHPENKKDMSLRICKAIEDLRGF